MENPSQGAEQAMMVRRYRKGEKRYKHVSRTNRVEFTPHRGNPKKFVGKCPNDISQKVCEDVLRDAIPSHLPDAHGRYPSRLYAFHRGIIFEFPLSDHRRDYHAFPLRGPMPRSMMRRLRESLGSEADRNAYDAWIEAYVQQGA